MDIACIPMARGFILSGGRAGLVHAARLGLAGAILRKIKVKMTQSAYP